MGKTEKGAVWLDSNRTSPYEYYQYWVNIEDKDVEKFLALFTFLPMHQIRQLGQLKGSEIREAKQLLAFETTSIIHGKEEALSAQEASKSLFSGSLKSDKSNVPSTKISSESFASGLDIYEIFMKTQLCKSKGEARRLQAQGGVYVNEERIDHPSYCLGKIDLKDGEILLRAGKKRYHRLIIEK